MAIPEGFELVEPSTQIDSSGDIPDGFELVSAPEQQPAPQESLLAEVESAFQKIPGAPTLSEFAAGVNRSALGALDFLGPDNINAVLQLSGSEKRVPTFTEALGAERGAFLEPGLQQDIAATAGEFVPLAAGIGSLLRTGAQKLSPLTSGTEGTASGLLRQAGQTTARQDVTAGALAGAGAEIGEEVGGEPGALIGSIAAPLVTIPLSIAKTTATKLLRESAPSIDELKATARGIYTSLDESGFRVPAQSFDNLAGDVTETMRRQGFDVDLHPKVGAVLRRLNDEVGTDKSLQEMDILRRVARSAASSIDRDERHLGGIIINRMDDFLDSQSGKVDGQEVGQAFRSARDLWGRVRRSEILEDAVRDAGNQASGFENGLRTQFRSILKKINKGTLQGFTDEEVAAIEVVNKGTKAGNVARAIGKFGILDGLTSRSLTTLSGSGLAGFFGGGGAAAAVPIVGQLSGALSQRMTQNNAKMADAIIRAGKNGNKIATAYLRNTPADKRDPTELAQLFLQNDVPVKAINLKKSSSIVSDAAILAAVVKINENGTGPALKTTPIRQMPTERPQLRAVR